MNEQPEHTSPEPDRLAVPYEAPKIERVITQAEMEREVLFAGPGITNGDQPNPGF